MKPKTYGDIMELWNTACVAAGIEYIDYLYHLLALNEIEDDIPENRRIGKLLSGRDVQKLNGEIRKLVNQTILNSQN
jgi:hypothetical protein